MKRLLYIKMFITLLLVFGFIGCQKSSDIASNSIGFDTVSVIGSNEICQIAARMVCFDKNTILAYYNTEESPDRMPNPYCFNKEGKEFIVPSCYEALSNFAELLVEDNIQKEEFYFFKRDTSTTVKLKRSPFISSIKRMNGKRSIYFRQNLKDFLRKHDVRLMNNQRLDETMLPKSDYYLFVDWVFPMAMDVFSEIDSIATLHSDKITFIAVHACNPSVIAKKKDN